MGSVRFIGFRGGCYWDSFSDSLLAVSFTGVGHPKFLHDPRILKHQTRSPKASGTYMLILPEGPRTKSLGTWGFEVDVVISLGFSAKCVWGFQKQVAFLWD